MQLITKEREMESVCVAHMSNFYLAQTGCINNFRVTDKIADQIYYRQFAFYSMLQLEQLKRISLQLSGYVMYVMYSRICHRQLITMNFTDMYNDIINTHIRTQGNRITMKTQLCHRFHIQCLTYRRRLRNTVFGRNMTIVMFFECFHVSIGFYVHAIRYSPVHYS